MSETVADLAPALVKFHADAPQLIKSHKNPHLKNTYAGLDDTIDATRAALVACGLVVVQTFEPTDNADLLNVTTTLMHTSGQWISGTMTLPCAMPGKGGATPQASGSSATYGRRYGYQAILSLVGEDDDDAERAMGRGGSKPTVRRPDPTDDFASEPPAPKTKPRSKPKAAPAADGVPTAREYDGVPPCPVCGGAMDDKRKWDGKIAFKCQDSKWDKETKTASGCTGVYWMDNHIGGASAQKQAGSADDAPMSGPTLTREDREQIRDYAKEIGLGIVDVSKVLAELGYSNSTLVPAGEYQTVMDALTIRAGLTPTSDDAPF